MVEIIVLLLLIGHVGKIARRRGRNPGPFVLGSLALWFTGECVGLIIGCIVESARTRGGEWSILMIYGLGLVGAAMGGIIALVMGRLIPPVGGTFHPVPERSGPRSRLFGAVAGGIGGVVIGAGTFFLLWGPIGLGGNLMLPAALAVGTIAALLGMISGVDRDSVI
jgi:hypothetical protein